MARSALWHADRGAPCASSGQAPGALPAGGGGIRVLRTKPPPPATRSGIGQRREVCQDERCRRRYRRPLPGKVQQFNALRRRHGYWRRPAGHGRAKNFGPQKDFGSRSKNCKSVMRLSKNKEEEKWK